MDLILKFKKIDLDNALAAQISAMAQTGYPTPVDPNTAKMMGIINETAITKEDALESRFDGTAKMNNYRVEATRKIIDRIENGTAPFWRDFSKDDPRPINPVTDKAYSGFNNFMLQIKAKEEGYKDPRWMTYSQAKDAGASVKEGEHSTQIEYWQMNELSRPEVFYAQVFNAEQIDGLEPYKAPKRDFDPIEEAQKTIKKSGINIKPVELKYDDESPPPYDKFSNTISYAYYDRDTLNDELIYQPEVLREIASVALNRVDHSIQDTKFRSDIASMMLAERLGTGMPSDCLCYMSDSYLESDPNEVVRTFCDAEKAVTWILEPEKRPELERQAAKEAEASASKAVDAIKPEARHYINVPYIEHNDAKAEGARWDSSQKAWYVAKDSDLKKIAKWNTPPPEAKNTISPAKEFGDYIRAEGIELKGDPIMDGEWHRVKLGKEGRESGDYNNHHYSGAYKAHPDGKPNGLYESYRKDGHVTRKWIATGVTIDANEQAAMQSKRAERQQERAKDDFAAAQKQGANASAIIDKEMKIAPLKNKVKSKSKGKGVEAGLSI